MDLSERIIRTVCYFDLFDYPLTRAEICRWLFDGDRETGIPLSEVAYGDADKAVDALVAAKILKESNGFVQLAVRGDDLSATRESRYRHSCRKWRRALRWARVFAAIPGIELVGVGNTLAYNNAKDDSDIDFFIVTKPGTIWRSRFFCASLAALFNLRPRPGDNRDKLCLSFFVSSAALNIPALAGKFNDVYLRYWVRQMVPLCGSEGAAARWRAANGNLGERSAIGAPSHFFRVLFSAVAVFPGGFAHRWQDRHFPENLRRGLEKRDGSVVVSDDVLKFHVGDRRREVYEKWEKKVESILHEALQNRQSN